MQCTHTWADAGDGGRLFVMMGGLVNWVIRGVLMGGFQMTEDAMTNRLVDKFKLRAEVCMEPLGSGRYDREGVCAEKFLRGCPFSGNTD